MSVACVDTPALTGVVFDEPGAGTFGFRISPAAHRSFMYGMPSALGGTARPMKPASSTTVST